MIYPACCDLNRDVIENEGDIKSRDVHTGVSTFYTPTLNFLFH
jgi:hypothetical protein